VLLICILETTVGLALLLRKALVVVEVVVQLVLLHQQQQVGLVVLDIR
jgi:hypothetical protein